MWKYTLFSGLTTMIPLKCSLQGAHFCSREKINLLISPKYGNPSKLSGGTHNQNFLLTVASCAVCAIAREAHVIHV